MFPETDADRAAALKAVGRLVQCSRGSSKWNAWGVFDRAFVEVLGTEAVAPGILLREIDCYAPDHVGEAAYFVAAVDVAPEKVAGDHYTVVGTRPDGTGIVALVLEKAV